MTRSGLGERPFEQCPVMAGLVAKVGDRAAVASQLTQTRHAAPSHSITTRYKTSVAKGNYTSSSPRGRQEPKAACAQSWPIQQPLSLLLGPSPGGPLEAISCEFVVLVDRGTAPPLFQRERNRALSHRTSGLRIMRLSALE